jgi:hypothetical protein
MKVLKKISLIVVAIIALFLIVAVFLPSEYVVKRGIEINKPVDQVYGYVADFNNFQGWNPWTPLEPGHKFVVLGDSATVGQKYSWEGKIIGTGEMVFTQFSQNEAIKSDIAFLSPQQGKGVVEWTFEGDSNMTNVSWSLIGEAGYPLGRYYGLIMDSMLGPSFEDGMKNLKKKCEAN